ncbi:MAG: hypothetical protein N2C14_11245 [Planctomycetales bacterium]
MRYLMIAFVLAFAAADLAFAQATSVQLPTFSFFTVNTTVSVPDSGTAYLGGIKRSSQGRAEFGSPLGPKNRAFGQQTSASGVSVTARVIIHEEEEAKLLGGLAPSFPISQSGWDRRMQLVRNQPVAAPPARAGLDPRSGSLAEIRQQKETAQDAQQQKALGYFARGQEAEVKGKANVAKLYYKMAAKRAVGELRGVILARMESLNSPQVASQPRSK